MDTFLSSIESILKDNSKNYLSKLIRFDLSYGQQKELLRYLLNKTKMKITYTPIKEGDDINVLFSFNIEDIKEETKTFIEDLKKKTHL